MHTTGLQTDDAAEHPAASQGRHPIHVRRDYDVQSILAVLRRQTKPIIGLTLLGGAVAALYLLVAPLQYTATARLMIDTRGQKIFDYSEVRTGLNSESLDN